MRVKLFASAAIVAIIMPLGIGIASAQAGVDPNVGAESANQADSNEIVVTARRRSERYLDVPVVANVFTSDAIEQAGIGRPDDFIPLVPNVTLTNSQDAGTSFLSIRGLTQVRNGESPVAFVVDGVTSISPIQFTQDLFDVQQIEVLKGPQGALYGRNAIGGAITIVTKEPTNELEGKATIGAGNGGAIKAQVSVGGPIVKDKLLFRAAGSFRQTDGLIENVYLQENVDRFKERAGRLQLKWLPTDRLTVDLRGAVSHSTGGALWYVVNSDLYTGGPDYVGDSNDTSVPIEANVRGLDNRKLRDASMKIDYETDFGTLTSITAYSEAYERSAGDNAPYSSSGADGTQDGNIDVSAWSQEVRFTSPGDQPFRYILGGYYLDTKRDYQLTLGLDDGSGVLISGINPPGSVNETIFYLQDQQNNRAYAAFGQFNYDISEQLELSGALRYDQDRRRVQDLATTSPQREATFSAWQPKATLTYKPTKNVSVFAVYSEGFSSGGFNAAGVADLATAAGQPGVEDIFRAARSENYELGFKARLLGNMLAINGGAFKTKVRDQLYFSFIAPVGAQIITNIDRVDLQGFDIDATLKPAHGLTLYAGYGLTDSEIKAYEVNPTVVGNRAPYVPKYTANVGAQFELPLSDSLNMIPRVDYSRKGSQYWSPENYSARKAIDMVDARLTIKDEDSNWSLSAWAKNVFDERFNEEFVVGGFVQINTPRSWGADFTVNF